MSITGRGIITQALRNIGVLGAGQTAEGDDIDNCKDVLNTLLGTWNAEIGPIAFETVTTKTLTASDGEYSWGSGGDINEARPEQLLGAWIRDGSSNDIPMEIVSFKAYQDITLKTTTSAYPEYISLVPTSPTATIYLWPVPSSAYTLRMLSRKPISAFDLDTAVYLASGMERFMVWGLALEICPMFKVRPTELMVKHAVDSKAAIIAPNNEELVCDGSCPGVESTDDEFLYTA